MREHDHYRCRDRLIPCYWIMLKCPFCHIDSVYLNREKLHRYLQYKSIVIDCQSRINKLERYFQSENVIEFTYDNKRE